MAREFTSGALTGALGKTFIAPLERVKILYQTGRFTTQTIPQALAQIVRTEGFRGLFKGNLAGVARIAPYSAIHFGAFEALRRGMYAARDRATGAAPHAGQPPGAADAAFRSVADFVAGAGAGATAVIGTYPLDVTRTRLAYMIEHTPPQAGRGAEASGGARPAPDARGAARGAQYTIRGLIGQAVREDGARGLYRGVWPTLLGIIPYAGLKFLIYEGMKRHPPDAASSGAPQVWWALLSGAVAGLVGQTATYPLDVVRRRMQVQGTEAEEMQRFHGRMRAAWVSAEEPYRGVGDGLRRIVQAHGWGGLFSGMSINLVKVVPSTAVGFVMYDTLKGAL
ncbi:unnamed protein product [Pedinophyceae sp. YPF-701]|nr:unnamed protein product [Pedinophyceae sp. YPF-701]